MRNAYWILEVIYIYIQTHTHTHTHTHTYNLYITRNDVLPKSKISSSLLPVFFGTTYQVSKYFRSYIHNISWIHLLSLGLDLQHCSPGLLSLGLIFPCPLTPKLTIKECLFWLYHSPDYNNPRFPTVYRINFTSYFSSSDSPKQQCPNFLRSYFLYFLVFRIFLYCGFWCTFPNLLSTLQQPTPVLLPGKSHRWRSLVGYSPWRHKESDTTEWLHFLSLCQLY